MSDTQASFFATLVDEWARNGVTNAVVSPGNRSTLLSALLAQDERINVHVIVDERSASFFALGLAKASGVPTLVWTTSGTATAELHAAVIEAHHDNVPLLVCTADRPPELHHGRDWQSIDQSRLYEGLLRWQFDPGVAEVAMSSVWRSIASRSVIEATVEPGPVHLNLSIREPWSIAGEAAPGRAGGQPWHQQHDRKEFGAVELLELEGRRGVLVAGAGAGPFELLELAAAGLGWPLVADLRSGCRRSGSVAVGEWLSPKHLPAEMRPEVMLHLGSPLVSKVIQEWFESSDIEHWVVQSQGPWAARSVRSPRLVFDGVEEVCVGAANALQKTDPSWRQQWEQVALRVQDAYDASLGEQPSEPAVARTLVAGLADQSNLFVATSMPVRDVEEVGAPRNGLRVFANRGASGMEGMISTAAGVAAANDRPTTLLCGDLSFLYDTNALWALRGTARPVDLVMVVVDNNGGGIFSSMPQLSGIDRDIVERVAITPHHVDIPLVAQSFSVGVQRVRQLSELMPAVNRAHDSGGLQLVHIAVDRDVSAQARSRLRAAAVEAVKRA